jgi:hypothetical protein
MPIAINHESQTAGDLGSAYFLEDKNASNASRLTRATARGNRTPRPIEISVTSDNNYLVLGFSLDEAEALIASLNQVVALRRTAEAEKAA